MTARATESTDLPPRLQDLGFVDDPFGYVIAEKMPDDIDLWERLFVEHPKFNEVEDVNQSTVLLAERGGGKTAHRLYFSRKLAVKYPNWLVVPYDSFSPLAEKLPNIQTDDHFFTIMSSIADSLLKYIKNPDNKENLFKESSDRDANSENKISDLPYKFYDLFRQSFNESEIQEVSFELSIDYESLSGKNKDDKARELIRFCQRKNCQAELKNIVVKKRPHISWPEIPQSSSSVQSQYHQFTLERKWLWAFLHTFSAHDLQFELDNELLADFNNHGGKTLSSPFRTNIPLDNVIKNISRQLNMLGITRLFILIDGVDGLQEFAEPSSMKALLSPLLNGLSLLSIENVFWKFFLPKLLEPVVKNSGGYETRRFLCVSIEWDQASLAKFLNERLKWASEGLYQRIEDLCSQELLQYVNIEEELANMAMRHKYLGPPRALLHFSSQLFSA